MPDTPADTLRAAAARIREHAAAASPGPWMIRTGQPWLADRVVFGQSMCMPGRIAQVCNVDYGQNHGPDAAWIALMHPGVGELIADWLESAARTWEFVTYSNRDAALAVARAVLDSRDS